MHTSTNYSAALASAGFELRNGDWHIGVSAYANIAEDTVGRYARSERKDHPALIFEDEQGLVHTLSIFQAQPLSLPN